MNDADIERRFPYIDFDKNDLMRAAKQYARERGPTEACAHITLLCERIVGLERERDEARACAASERNQAVNLIASWRRSAKCLRGEVERGVCIRQSAEEKLRAAGVLEVCADELERTGGPADGQ